MHASPECIKYYHPPSRSHNPLQFMFYTAYQYLVIKRCLRYQVTTPTAMMIIVSHISNKTQCEMIKRITIIVMLCVSNQRQRYKRYLRFYLKTERLANGAISCFCFSSLSTTTSLFNRERFRCSCHQCYLIFFEQIQQVGSMARRQFHPYTTRLYKSQGYYY